VKQLIFNADDFGLDPAINAAVMQAHTHGLLTSASLLVAAPFAQEAIEFARSQPRLGLGIHLWLVDELTPAAPARIAELANARGEWPSSPRQLGVVLGPARARAIEREVRAQLAAFRQTGLTPTHLDTHMHTHLLPGVRAIVARLAREFGVRYVRAPVEPLLPFLRCRPKNIGRALARGAIFGTLGRYCRYRLRRSGLQTADRAVGVLNAGQLTEQFLLAYAPYLPDGLTEVVFHPAVTTTPQLAQRQSGYQHAAELQALCSTPLREALAKNGVQLTNFRDVAGR